MQPCHPGTTIAHASHVFPCPAMEVRTTPVNTQADDVPLFISFKPLSCLFDCTCITCIIILSLHNSYVFVGYRPLAAVLSSFACAERVIVAV